MVCGCLVLAHRLVDRVVIGEIVGLLDPSQIKRLARKARKLGAQVGDRSRFVAASVSTPS